MVHSFLRAISDQALPDYYELIPYIISFPQENIHGNSGLSCRFLFEDYPTLFKQLSSKVSSTIEGIDLENFVVKTLQANVESFQRVISNLNGQLSTEEMASLKLEGINAFSSQNSLLQVRFFQLIQAEAERTSKARETLITMRNGFIWVLRLFDIKIKDAFPIPINRTKKHKQRLRQDDYFSVEECRALAFFVEKELRKETITKSRKTQLLLARVFLKTGWNLSDVLRLKIDDISQYSANKKQITEVRLQKARAGYKTTAHLFVDDELDNSTIKSAAKDLKEIAQLTEELRSQLPDETEHKDHLLLIKNPSGITMPVSNAFPSNIRKFLIRAGCPVKFNTQKIRKGYSNALYREVSKNFREYESKNYHTIETFLNSYHRIKEQDSISKLSAASETLGRLLRGKPAASEITIELPKATAQITPAGFCQVDTTDTLQACSDFNICPLCKYHRLVADPIHVWKSLSHIEHINHTLSPVLVNAESVDSPTVAVAGILKEKISSAIEQIRKADPKAAAKGEQLYAKEGIHPDWKILST